MDIEKLIAANDKFDKEFQQLHPDFARWWRNHSGCDSDPKWQIKPRVAYKCEYYYQEFMKDKEVGIV